jgi:hypothetical protein
LTVVAYVSTYVAAWTAAQIVGFLAFVRSIVGFIAPADVAEFVTRPYVFSGLCLVAVAVITSGSRLLMWWVNNSMKLRLREQSRQLETQSKLLRQRKSSRRTPYQSRLGDVHGR